MITNIICQMPKAGLLFIFLFMNLVNGQDIITQKNGIQIEAKVLEITMSEIKYKRYDHPDGPVYTMLTIEVSEILYKNGFKDVFNEPMPMADAATDSQTEQLPFVSACTQGSLDAQLFYRGHEKISYLTFASGCLTGPLIGLIPTAAFAFTPIAEKNLNYPNTALRKNSEYKDCYAKEANSKKKKAAFKGYAAGSGLFIIGYITIIVLFFSAI